MVREAVLKSKDPQRILEEIEKIETLGNLSTCTSWTASWTAFTSLDS